MFLTLAIMVFMIGGYIVGRKIHVSNGAIAMATIVLIGFTGIVPASDILSSFVTSNILQLVSMFIIAAGFNRTQAVKKVTRLIYKVSGGRFVVALAGYAIMGFLLTNLGLTPVTAFAVIGPLAASCCDDFGISPSKIIYPVAIVCIASIGVLPIGAGTITYVTQNGYYESYGYANYAMNLLDPCIGRLPIALLLLVYAIFLAPRFCPAEPSTEITFVNKAKSAKELEPLSPIREVIGYGVFAIVTVALIFQDYLGGITGWQIAFAGATVVMLSGVLTTQEGIKAIPMRIVLMLAAASVVGSAMLESGLGDAIGNAISGLLGNTHNGYLIGAIFFTVPFILTQFMNNQSVGHIFTPILILTCKALGCNPVGPTILLLTARQTAFWTPASTASIAMASGLGGYDQKDLIKMGWMPSLVIGVLGVLWVMTVFPAFPA